MSPRDPYVLLDPTDNVLVCRFAVRAGEPLVIEGETVTATVDVGLGHKLARHALRAGDKVIKYGAPIGSMTAPAARGEHVHMHNMKSDYLASHSRQSVGGA